MDRGRMVAAFAALVIGVGGTAACAESDDQFGNDGSGSAGEGTFHGEVIARTGLNIRSAPTTRSASVGALATDTSVRIVCKVQGQNIDGNPRWYQLSQGRWVAARYVTNVGAIPTTCPERR